MVKKLYLINKTNIYRSLVISQGNKLRKVCTEGMKTLFKFAQMAKRQNKSRIFTEQSTKPALIQVFSHFPA